MKICTRIRVTALRRLDGDATEIGGADVMSLHFVADDYEPVPLGRPVEVGDVLDIIGEVVQ